MVQELDFTSSCGGSSDPPLGPSGGRPARCLVRDHGGRPSTKLTPVRALASDNPYRVLAELEADEPILVASSTEGGGTSPEDRAWPGEPSVCNSHVEVPGGSVGRSGELCLECNRTPGMVSHGSIPDLDGRSEAVRTLLSGPTSRS